MMSDAALVETLIVVQREHYKKASSTRYYWHGDLREGFIECACGERRTLAEGETPTNVHRRHLAEQIVRLVNYATGGDTHPEKENDHG